jgi:hypothetical protein
VSCTILQWKTGISAHDYCHRNGNRSITARYRDRGSIPAFNGLIVHADFCCSAIFFGKPDGASVGRLGPDLVLQ